MLSPTRRQITHVLLTRPPLPSNRSWPFARLACLKRAASVRSEPGSNSPLLCTPIRRLRLVTTLSLPCHSLSNSWLIFQSVRELTLTEAPRFCLKDFSFNSFSFPSLIYLSKIFINHASLSLRALTMYIKIRIIVKKNNEKFARKIQIWIICLHCNELIKKHRDCSCKCPASVFPDIVSGKKGKCLFFFLDSHVSD